MDHFKQKQTNKKYLNFFKWKISKQDFQCHHKPTIHLAKDIAT